MKSGDILTNTDTSSLLSAVRGTVSKYLAVGDEGRTPIGARPPKRAPVSLEPCPRCSRLLLSLLLEQKSCIGTRLLLKNLNDMLRNACAPHRFGIQSEIFGG